MRAAIALLLFVACSANDPTTTSDVRVDQPVTIRFGQTATVANVRLTFADVNDSRCPKNVNCVWAGDAAVRITSGTDSIVLHTNGSVGSNMGTIAGVNVELVRVNPEPPDGDTPKSSYSITLQVGR